MSAFAIKGRLLAVGGGSEQDIAPSGSNPGGWSTPAYKWAVDKSSNKRVAIIGTGSNPSTFLGNYFKTSCGAVFTKDFTVSSSTTADMQELYDTLITYDVIFFRGGDQSQYYNNYRGKKLAQAVDSVFRRGGVIAGTSAGLHILSGIVYAALNSSSSGYTSLANVKTTDITLRNDFFNFFPGYVFDSHVAERGRLPRTMAFMGRWFVDNNEKIGALAVDDLTAIGIDTNQIGTVFGTGTVGVYRSVAKNTNAFKTLTNNKLTGDSIKVVHLLNGWKYNFKTYETIKPTITGTYAVAAIANRAENSPLTILMGGSDNLNFNTSLLGHFVNETGRKNVPIYIITQSDSSVAKGFKNTLLTVSGAEKVNIIIHNNVNSVNRYAQELKTARKILFVGNTLSSLQAFINTNSTAGVALRSRFTTAGVNLAFVGKDSRFVGKTAISDNFLTGESYLGQLSSSKALGILKNTFVLPYGLPTNATGADVQMENTSTAATYYTVKDTIAQTILIPGNISGMTFVKYYTGSDNKTYLSSYGAVPAFIFQNFGTEYAFSSTTSRGNGMQVPRQIAGFDSLYVSLFDHTNPVMVGENQNMVVDTTDNSTDTTTLNTENNTHAHIHIYPNPTTTTIRMEHNIPNSEILNTQLIDFSGKEVFSSKGFVSQIPVYGLPSGIYILLIRTTEQVIEHKIMVGPN